MTLNAAIRGLIPTGKRRRLSRNMTKQRTVIAEANEMTFRNLVVVFRAKASPTTVDNSATAFIDAPTMSPLRARMTTKAITEVKTPGTNPKR